MSFALFAYPKQAVVDKVVPKSRIYANAKLSTALKKQFVAQIGKISWSYKLSPETVNLPATSGVSEIQVFSIAVHEMNVREQLLRAIDNAIPFPILFELIHQGRIKLKAAHKRPSEADSSKWVTDTYFESDWIDANAERSPMPVALDLSLLYEQLLRSLVNVPRLEGENIREQTERVTKIRSLEAKASKLRSHMQSEKQFNRKVELNAKLRTVREEIDRLRSYAN